MLPLSLFFVSVPVSSEQSRSQFMCIKSAAAALLCVAILLLLLQLQCYCILLLFVIVCRIAKFVAGSLNLIPVFSFPSFKRDIMLRVPLGSNVSHLQPRFAYILGNYGHARRRGGRQPATANSPLYAYRSSLVQIHLGSFMWIDLRVLLLFLQSRTKK